MLFSQDVDANEKDNSKEFLIAVKYEADLVIRGYVHFFHSISIDCRSDQIF